MPDSHSSFPTCSAGHPVDPNVGQFCPTCGAVVACINGHLATVNDALFCGDCGARLATGQQASSPTGKASRPLVRRVSFWVAGGVLAVFVLLLLIGAMALLPRESGGEDAASNPFGSLSLVPGREQPVEVKETTFGPAGGVVRLDDGASVTVSEGALASASLLRIERILPGLEDLDETIGSSVIYRVTLGEGSQRKVEPPLILEIPWSPDRTLVVSMEDGQWVSPQLASTDTVRVELDHFSTRTVLAVGASFASGLRTVAEQVSSALPRWDLRADVQAREAAHRKRIEARSLATQQFFGVGEITKRPHSEMCEEFKTALMANTTTLTFSAPAGAPGTYGLTKHLGDAGKPSAGDAASKWFWDATSPSHDAIRQKVIAGGAGNPMSPAAVLRIAIDANGGSVPLGVLAAHNVLKEIAYSGREIADPTETYVGSIQDVPAADGQFVASIETWRSQSSYSPSGRYDKMGPLYHIFAAMTARVWGGEAYAQSAISAEAFLRSVGWGSDIPDPEKGAADECGRDIGEWLIDFVALGFEPATGKVEVGKDVPLTLTVRNLGEKGVSVEFKVLSGEGSLSRSGLGVSKSGSGGACDVTGTTAVCGLVFTPSKTGEAVVEARSGKTSATVRIGSDPQIRVTVNWNSRSTIGSSTFPVGRVHPMAVEVFGSIRGTPESVSPAPGRLVGVGGGTVGCQGDSTTPATAAFTTSRLRLIDPTYLGDDFFVWVNSSQLCSLLGDGSFAPRITWSAEIQLGDDAPVVCKGSYVNVVPNPGSIAMQRQLAARINLTASPVVTCIAN